MSAQIRDFERVTAELRARMGNQIASAFLAESLFFFRVGSNDLFLQSSFGRPKDQIVATVISKFRDQLKVVPDLNRKEFEDVIVCLL